MITYVPRLYHMSHGLQNHTNCVGERVGISFTVITNKILIQYQVTPAI